ncbi:hypothetical protein EZS27_022106 [termite gut metagenome]|uniref:Uncharacterized protein n=1 Tax=termite gut metagenome TaxID=433724 RepID=A0A5J4R8Q1_9ZZZZ
MRFKLYCCRSINRISCQTKYNNGVHVNHWCEYHTLIIAISAEQFASTESAILKTV